MQYLDEILIIFSLLVTGFFTFVLILALLKQRGKQVVLALACAIPFALLSNHLLTPGSESIFGIGSFKYQIKSPSKVGKFLGDKTKSLKGKNIDTKESETIIVSGTSEVSRPNFDLLKGEEFVKDKWRSKDGKRLYYLLEIPATQEVETATGVDVLINVFSPEDLPPDFQIFPRKHLEKDKPKKNTNKPKQ